MFLFVCLVAFWISEVSATATLQADRFVQALGNDVTLKVRNAEVGGSVELFRHDEREPITAQRITKNIETLVFDCGYFLKTASYIFKIKDRSGLFLPANFTVTCRDYPRINIHWPRKHVALHNDVKVSIESKSEMCNSDIAKQNKLKMRLVTLNGSKDEKTRDFPIAATQAPFLPHYYVLPCAVLNMAGKFRIDLLLTSTTQDAVTLAQSNVLEVELSNKYDVELVGTPFPCTGRGVSVRVTSPPCAPTRDTVRVMTSAANGSEISSRAARDHVTFPCHAFYRLNSTTAGLCFEYVTHDGRVRRRICEPTGRSGFLVDGLWSAWSEWRECDRPCLGIVRRRRRVCDNPKPRGNGNLCRDNTGNLAREETLLSVKNGSKTECDRRYESVLLQNDACRCGCSLRPKESGMIDSSLGQECDGAQRTLIWTLEAPIGKAFHFELISSHHDDESITIRDLHASCKITSIQPTVTSRSNISIVQYVRARDILDSCGFVLFFDIVESAATSQPATSGTVVESKDVLTLLADNPVVAGGIGACVVIIVSAIVAVLIRKKRKEKPFRARKAGYLAPSPADDAESEPIVPPTPIGDSGNGHVISDSSVSTQPSTVSSNTAYYLAQRQLEVMKRLGKNQHSQSYATCGLSDESIRHQEELLFGDRKSLHNNDEFRLRVT